MGSHNQAMNLTQEIYWRETQNGYCLWPEAEIAVGWVDGWTYIGVFVSQFFSFFLFLVFKIGFVCVPVLVVLNILECARWSGGKYSPAGSTDRTLALKFCLDSNAESQRWGFPNPRDRPRAGWFSIALLVSLTPETMAAHKWQWFLYLSSVP